MKWCTMWSMGWCGHSWWQGLCYGPGGSVYFKNAMVFSIFPPIFRNFELTRLKWKHITLDCHRPVPYQCYHTPYFKVLLENRKGWQKKMSQEGMLQSLLLVCSLIMSPWFPDLPLTGNTYNVYKQDIPEIDMYTHLPRWINYLELLLGWHLGPDECIFPYFRPKCIPDMSWEMTQEMVQSLINAFTSEASLSKYFTTHCFQRGGAQYRFMYAPIGQHWSLCKICWWGGWADGEHVSTTSHYSTTRQLILTGSTHRLTRWSSILSTHYRAMKPITVMCSVPCQQKLTRASWVIIFSYSQLQQMSFRCSALQSSWCFKKWTCLFPI